MISCEIIGLGYAMCDWGRAFTRPERLNVMRRSRPRRHAASDSLHRPEPTSRYEESEARFSPPISGANWR
jgi:hypothetical protein